MKFATASVLATMAAAVSAAPTETDRRVGAIVGAFVADAAVMPLHWIYDTAEIARLVGDTEPEFHNPPSCPFYNYSLGENTQYGQQGRTYLQSIAENGWDPKTQQSAYFDFYGAKDAPCALHATEEVPCPPAQPNVTCCYWDFSTIVFVDNVRTNKTCLEDLSCGADDTQANALAHMIIPAARGGDNITAILQDTNDLVRITQNEDDAVAFATAGARILNNAIHGQSASDSVRSAINDLLQVDRVPKQQEDFVLAAGLHLVLEEIDMPNINVTMQVEQSCDYPNNLFSGAHILNQVMAPGTAGYDNATEAYINATRQLIMAGGDQASRSMFVGSVLGAIAGESGIPESWKRRYNHYDDVLAWAKKIVAK